MVLSPLAEKERSNHERGGPVSDARTGKRFPLHLPIKLHNEAASGDAKGTTGNLSAAGVYIRADASLDIGSPVEFEITLPPDVTGAQESVVIACKGRVVRTDPTGSTPDGKGVACVIDSYEFVRTT
jgi:PilZ domain